MSVVLFIYNLASHVAIEQAFKLCPPDPDCHLLRTVLCNCVKEGMHGYVKKKTTSRGDLAHNCVTLLCQGSGDVPEAVQEGEAVFVCLGIRPLTGAYPEGVK